jgi:hypothetical protein
MGMTLISGQFLTVRNWTFFKLGEDDPSTSKIFQRALKSLSFMDILTLLSYKLKTD